MLLNLQLIQNLSYKNQQSQNFIQNINLDSDFPVDNFFQEKILDNITIFKKILEVEKLLSELDKEILTIPNYQLLLQPLTVREAVASSEIENVMTTTLEMLQAELNNFEGLTGLQKEVFNYKTALLKGFETLNLTNLYPTPKLVDAIPYVTKQGIIDIHTTLLPKKSGLRVNPGTVVGTRLGEIIYRPPQDIETINIELDKLTTFINHPETNPILKIILTHYQFEAIHPFYDGNGRCGRILMALQFCLEKKLAFPILFVSGYILERKSTYYELFREIQTTGDYSNWITFHLNGIILQASETHFRVLEIKRLVAKFQTQIKDLKLFKLLENTKSQPSSNTNRATDYFFSRAFYTQTNLAKVSNINRNTAKTYLEIMKTSGVLESRRAGKELLYFMPEFVDLLH
jgi:Fic family protein